MPKASERSAAAVKPDLEKHPQRIADVFPDIFDPGDAALVSAFPL